MEDKSKYFETQRLILRKKELRDAEEMFNNYCSKDKVTKYLSWDTHKTLDDTISYLKNAVLPMYDENSAYEWAVV